MSNKQIKYVIKVKSKYGMSGYIANMRMTGRFLITPWANSAQLFSAKVVEERIAILSNADCNVGIEFTKVEYKG